MPPLIWLPRDVRRACAADADEHFPNESGGAFMGYAAHDAVVITSMIPGGPSSCRTPTSYEPDVSWQNRQIGLHYKRSRRLDTYLGDWHSHPNSSRGYLSGDDRAVLKKIILDPNARAPEPIMILLAGSKGDWSDFAWRARLGRWLIFSGWVELDPAQVRIFSLPMSASVSPPD